MRLGARVLLALVGLLAALPAAAGTGAPGGWGNLDALATGRSVAGPAGWLNWCMAEPGRCRPATAPGISRATPELMALLAEVQSAVNAAVEPRAEPRGQDLWQIADGAGDCEDYALAKQARLRAAGLPAGAIRIATARLPHGELHAVLAVDTDRGTLVLDNLRPHVVPVAALGYEWLRVQATDGSLLWAELGDPGTPVDARLRPAGRPAAAVGATSQGAQ